MSNADLARRFFEEMCNQRKLDIAADILSADHQYHDPNSPPAVGPQAMADVVGLYQNGVDGHWDVQLILESGDYAVVRWIGRGRHIGEINGVPPTGRTVAVDAQTILRIQDGKIAENWTVWDTLTFLKQIGVVPSEAPAAAGS